MNEEYEARLILLAAKAAGLKVQYSNNCGDFSIGEPYSKGEVRWNPLNDDSDAFRLAVKLGIGVVCYDNLGYSHASAERISHSVVIKEWHDGDVYASTRIAIVRAAAEIENPPQKR